MGYCAILVEVEQEVAIAIWKRWAKDRTDVTQSGGNDNDRVDSGTSRQKKKSWYVKCQRLFFLIKSG